MAAIDFGRMERVLTRCEELAQQAETATSVKTVYGDRLAPASREYVALKNVLRNTHGPKSPQYRRIHLRSEGTFAHEEPGDEGAA